MNNFLRALILTAAAALFGVACTQKVSPVPVDTAAKGDVPEKRGTSDSGGGTGVDGKMFESYIVEPTALPAFREHLASRFANLKVADPKESLVNMFGVKTWYLAPIDLERIEKGLLGVSFMQNSTTQIARQKSREIWIDSRVYDAMKPDTLAQATTLAHEWVMSLYMVRFLTFSQFCRQLPASMEACDSLSEEYDDVAPPEPARVLNEQDNENIRYVTDWFMRNLVNPVSQDDFQKVLLSRNFDRRIFQPKTPEQYINVTRAQLFEALAASRLTDNLPDRCSGLTLNTTTTCKLKFTERSDGLAVHLELPDLRLTDLKVYVNEDVTLTKVNDLGTGDYYVATFIDFMIDPKIGDRTHLVAFFFEKPAQAGPLELRSVTLRTSLIVSVEPKRDPMCYARAPKVKTLLDDRLVIRREGLSPLTIERGFAKLSPEPICLPSQTDQSPTKIDP